MNLGSLIQWSMAIILGWATVNHIEDIHRSILKAQAQLIYDSRGSSWGSPRIFKK